MKLISNEFAKEGRDVQLLDKLMSHLTFFKRLPQNQRHKFYE